MSAAFEKENAAASEALGLYIRRLVETFGTTHELVEALRGRHMHYATVAGDDGKPCSVRATFEFDDEPAAVLKAIATATHPPISIEFDIRKP